MNVKGKARGGPEALANHLENAEENEAVRLIGIHGLVAGDLRGALLEMDALGTMLRTDRTLYHGSINPDPKDRAMTAEEWAHAEAEYIKKMGFENQPYAVIEHEKLDKTGILRTHRHIVTALTDLDHMRAIRTDHNYRKHEEVARDLERYLGHDRVQGAHAERFGEERPQRAPTQTDYQQAKYTKIDPKEVKALGAQLWQTADSGKAISAALDSHGWTLARGDKQRADGGTYFMAIDPRGGTHELRRMVPVKAAELYARMADIDPAGLPSVTEAKTRQRARDIGREARQSYEALAPVKPLEQTDTLSDGHARASERPLNRTQGDIRMAFTLSGSREELQEALAGRHISLARVSTDEARESRDHAKLYREQRQGHEQWKAEAAFKYPVTHNPRGASSDGRRYAGLKPEPPQPLRYAPTLKVGEIVAVDGRGQTYRLDRRTTGIERGEIDKRLGGIDAGSLRNITDAKAAMIEASRTARETEQAQRRIDALLGKIAGDIRTAWTLSRSQEQLHAALAGRDLGIARVTAEEAKASEGRSADAKTAGTYAPLLKEGELVAVNGFGNVYRFDEHTTGQFRSEIEKRLAGIDAGSLASVADTTAKVRETAKAAWLAQQRDERDRERPASAIENKIIECVEQARLHGATVRQNRQGEIVSGVDALADRLKPEKEQQTHSATVRGNQATAARLDQAGIAIVRVTEADVRTVDALRSAEELARATAKDVQGRKARIFAKVEAGDLAAVTKAGNVFRLNPHRVDVAGLESAISSIVPQAKRSSAGLPGVTETRARFESEGQKKTALWDQRRVASTERRASRQKSFSRQQTMRRAATAAIGKPGETVNRSLKPAGKGAGIVGRGIFGALAGLFKLFDLFPAKPPSPEQQKRNFYAAKEQEATDAITAKKATAAEQERQQRKNQEQDLGSAQILGIKPSAQGRSRPREHERDL